MTFLPVVARELVVGARRKSTYVNRVLTALLALLAMAWLLVLSAANLPMAEQGKTLFLTLSVLAFVFALFVGVGATSDCLSEEKREGTLGLLFLTDLRGYDVVGGKMAASSLSAIYTLLGIVPMLALALLLGGITLAQVAADALVLLNTLFVSLAIGVFVSAFSKNERRAMFATAFVIFGFCAESFLMAYIFDTRAAAGLALSVYGAPPQGFSAQTIFDTAVFWSNPIYPLFLVHRPTPFGLAPGQLWSVLLFPIVFQHLFAWALLVIASIVLPRLAHEKPAAGRIKKVKDFAERWAYGHGAKRNAYRARLLDKNPFTWLAARERMKPKYAWGVLIFFALFWCWIYWQFAELAFDTPVAVFVLLILHGIYKVWTASEVASRAIEDRRSGSLELLLSTFLSVKEIARGQSMALRRFFLKPVLVLLVLEFCLMMEWIQRRPGAADARAVFLAGMITLPLDLWAIKWLCMWNALFARTIGRVQGSAIARVMALPWLLMFLTTGVLALLSSAAGIPSGPGEAGAVYIWLAYSVAISVSLGIPARANFLRHFRELAAQRFDARVRKPSSLGLWVGDLLARVRRKKVEVDEDKSFWRRHWLLTSAAALVLLCFAISWARQGYWKHQVALRIAAIKNSGAPLNGKEIYKLLPHATDDAATLLLSSMPRLQPNGYQRIGDKWTAIEDDIPRLRAEVETNERQLKLLHNLPNSTSFKYNFDPADPWAYRTFYSLQTHITLLTHEGILATHDLNTEQTLAATRSLIALARLMKDQPYYAAQMVRQQSLTALGTVLAKAYSHPVFSPEDWLQIENEIKPLSAPDVLGQFLAIQRALDVDRDAQSFPFASIGMGVSGPQRVLFAVIYGFATQTGEKAKALAERLDAYQKNINVAIKPPDERWAEIVKYPVEYPRRQNFLNLSQSLGYLQSAFQQDTQNEARIRLLLAAVARVRLGPSSPPLPRDPFSKDLLKMKDTPHGFVVYSVGPDGKDNGGESNRSAAQDIAVRFEKTE